MKILINCLTMRKGGTERVIANLANTLIRKHEITIVSTLKEESEYDLDEKVKYLNVDNKQYINSNIIKKQLLRISYKRLRNLKKILIKENPDIIISVLPQPSLRVMFIKKFTKEIRNIPVIISERGDPSVAYKNPIIYKIMKFLFASAEGFIFQTEDVQKYFDNIINENSTVIPNPINKNFIRKEPAEKRAKTIISVGRLEKQKNNKLLIDAFNIVTKKNNEYKLVFYGGGTLENELKEYVKELGLAEKVIFMGKTDNIEQKIYNEGVFVLSSNYEGMPNVLMEAMASGLPCISTDCPVRRT